jgi:hypothetical protein
MLLCVLYLQRHEPSPNQHVPGFYAWRQQVVPNRLASPTMDGIHLFPAQVVQDKQMTARA